MSAKTTGSTPTASEPRILVERPEAFARGDISDLCDAAETAIVDGGGFGWLTPPPRSLMERYWRGVLLVPERELWLARLDGRIAAAAQLVLPPRNNEAQGLIATLTTNFTAPWARGRGLARALHLALEGSARRHGMWFINLDVRETQEAAIALYESLGYRRWGTNPNYAVVQGRVIAGHYYTKALREPRRDKEQKQPPQREGKDK